VTSPHVLPVGPLLAVETSGPTGSVALDTGGGRVGQDVLPERRGHGARILPAARRLLEGAGLGPGDLAGVVVGQGPGSFTGVRVAAAAGLGLAMAVGAPLFAVSSLAAGVLPGFGPTGQGTLLVLFDARGERLFAAGYRWSGGELGVPVPPHFTEVGALLARLRDDVPGPWACAGTGARRHAPVLADAGLEVLPGPAGDPTAAGALAVARRAPGHVRRWAPGQEPDYLRASSARRGG
jgi:tRNA threonylcarbamoyladenosine biosynthesis protein TsaB